MFWMEHGMLPEVCANELCHDLMGLQHTPEVEGIDPVREVVCLSSHHSSLAQLPEDDLDKGQDNLPTDCHVILPRVI